MWKEPHVTRMNFAPRHFQSFLPKKIEMGQPYWLIGEDPQQQQHFEHFSANR